MENEFNYDDMRPYHDDEVKATLEKLTNEPEFIYVLKFLYPNMDIDKLIQQLRSLNSIKEFQLQIIGPLILSIVQKAKGVYTLNGMEQLSFDEKYLFISNHRDIIMDAALLNTLFAEKGFDTTENAIGDNLCTRPWISDVLKLNKSFLIKRNGTKRELFNAFVKQSTYIRETITQKRNSIWLAQREGRAKDSDDRTQESLLKMLTISAKNNLKESFIELNITPICVSYEYDSCDYLKAMEFQQKRDNPDFKKSEEDDVTSMQIGITGYKGQMIYEVCQPINKEIEQFIQPDDDRNTILNKIAQLIDNKIHLNYHLFPCNYIALDNLNNESQFLGKHYTAEEKIKFEKYVDAQIEKIDWADKDIPFLKEKFWIMYANPAINQFKAMSKCNL